MPVSSTTMSAPVWRKWSSASAVAISKKVGCGSQPRTSSRIVVRPRTTSSSAIIAPSTWIRSRKCDEVRRGEEPSPVAGGAAKGIEHRADGAFAIRARDMDDAFVQARRKAEPLEEAAAVFEAELDPEALGVEEPGERFVRDSYTAIAAAK